jgi:2-oxo-4-hydroxy-4-carboxy-5-ureidoimidazoline decarboxylase
MSHEDRIEVINAHPRLGANQKTLSEMSYKEQGYDKQPKADDEVVNEQLNELNDAYENKFGFKFVCFVNGRPRSALIPVMEDRLALASAEQELFTGLGEMMAIARDRLRKLQQ